jgi:PHD/YefM family antitoxin component YafN of YafNO toxin-antitoxin module
VVLTCRSGAAHEVLDTDQAHQLSQGQCGRGHAATWRTERHEPMVITQNGEAKMVIQDVASYEQTQETMALLKILALGNRQIEEGKVVLARAAIERLRREKARS